MPIPHRSSHWRSWISAPRAFSSPTPAIISQQCHSRHTVDMIWTTREASWRCHACPFQYKTSRSTNPDQYFGSNDSFYGSTSIRTKTSSRHIVHVPNRQPRACGGAYFLFHAVNNIALLIANILEMENCSRYIYAVQALLLNWIQQGLRHNVVLYPVPVAYEQLNHGNVWQVLVDAALNFAMQYVMNNIPIKPKAHIWFVKHDIVIARHLLLPDYPKALWKYLKHLRRQVIFQIYFVRHFCNAYSNFPSNRTCETSRKHTTNITRTYCLRLDNFLPKFVHSNVLQTSTQNGFGLSDSINFPSGPSHQKRY